MESSSYIGLNRVMQWISGNIGYHHIHHFNVRIPFYRLPEAMQEIPELLSPQTTSLEPRDVRVCFACGMKTGNAWCPIAKQDWRQRELIIRFDFSPILPATAATKAGALIQPEN